MDDDDEFGDLYTDVLTSFAPSSSTVQPLPPPTTQSASTSFNLNRPIHLNAHSSDDEEILFGAANSQKTDLGCSHNNQLTLVFDAEKRDEKNATTASIDVSNSGYHRNSIPELVKAEDSGNTMGVSDRIFDTGAQVKVEEARGFEDPNFVDESAIDILVDDKGDEMVDNNKQGILVGSSENLDKFDIEEAANTGIGEEDIIPGLSIPGVSDSAGAGGGGVGFLIRGDGSGEGDDWDSDSEDDLQIVLNNDQGPMAMDRMGGADEDDEDEDGEPLVIVGDDDPNHQGTEDPDWGEDAAQGGDGDRKDLGDAVKVNGVVQPPKLPYSNHMYHPFHSQFKYVRPGAAPIPGASPMGPGVVPGQPRPPASVGPIAGRGRGDWRPLGPMQKNFHPGFGVPGWGNNGAGRGFGSGLEFTLPSHKTIFEVDIDSFEEKPWKIPGVEISDFFNFGMNEETWKEYCKQLEQLRLEATMQSRIRVYESGRTEQEYDPDMPPELAAAAGFHDLSSSANANNIPKNADAGGQSDLATDLHARPQLPTGRAIQVETGYGERLPSIDTRAPRMRDSDAIIEIVLQDSADDDTTPVNETTVGPDTNNDNSSRLNNLNDRPEIEEDVEYSEEHFNAMPQAYNNNDRKGEFLGRRPPLKNSGNLPDGDHILPFLPEVPSHFRPDSRVQNPMYPGGNSNFPHDERRTKGRMQGRSPIMGPTTQDKRSVEIHREDSVESLDDKHRPHMSSSPRTFKTTATRHFNDEDAIQDDVESPRVEREEMAFDSATTPEKDGNRRRSSKKQRLVSHGEQETDGGEDSKAARSSENSKARSGSSREYRNIHDGSAEEVSQDGRSTRIKRSSADDDQSFTNKRRDDRHRSLQQGRGEDPYYRKSSRDANPTHHSHMKRESNSDVLWLRKDEDQHGRRSRAEDTRKREVVDETGSRHRSKETGSRHVDNGNWRGHHEKDTGFRHVDREGSVKIRADIVDNLHSRKRKDHVERDEILHVQRESTSRRKRETDDILDQIQPSKRESLDQRKRTNDQRSVRHKEESWFQRVRVAVDRPREREESLYRREREEIRGSVRGGRSNNEEKEWVVSSNTSRPKDEYKGSVDREHHYKDTSRHGEQVKRRDRVESESVYAQPVNEERKSGRQERESTRSDRVNNHRVHEKKHRESSTRKNKESEGDHNSSAASRRNHEDHGSERVRLRGPVDEPRKHKDDASSDEEQQDSRRGRSKLERWTSHKERDFSLTAKASSSSSLHANKDIDDYKSSGPSLTKIPQESSKTLEFGAGPDVKTEDEKLHTNADEGNDTNKHLDTVAKLKKRSERFKLPMPSEKEALAMKKMENEPLPSSQTETRVDSEVKHERPPRKRRWTSS